MTDARVVRLQSDPATSGAVAGAADPPWLAAWLGRQRAVEVVHGTAALLALLRRSRPSLVLIDARQEAAADACAGCKRDPFVALVPCVALFAGEPGATPVPELLRAGADDAVAATSAPDEAEARLDRALARARRDLAAQPTTGLPGPPAIEALLTRHLRDGVQFAACYADLDHFKEYNDRYGFREGDRVIRMVARMLYDIAVGTAGDEAFVGHIGGDDFLCVLPLVGAAEACELMVKTFDLLAPLQYNASDQRAGYYLGKDRRGVLHRVPLMTLSLGVATTERRRFTSPADVSHLASEMKSFAKTLPGSVFAFDRRGDESPAAEVPLSKPA